MENLVDAELAAQLAKRTDWSKVVSAGEGEHRLQTSWSFWYDKKATKKAVHGSSANEYRAGLHKIGSFNTVENFWKLYVFLKRPSALENNVNLYLFRDGPTIAPMWECFPNGGSWILKVKKKKDSGASVLGKMWQDMVLATIGEMFEEPDVLGISVCIRWKEDLISVWHKDNRNENIRFGIGEKMKSILDLEASTVLEYKDFASSMRDMSSFRNAKAYVFAPSADSPPEPATIEEQAAAAVAAVTLASVDNKAENVDSA